ncbi:MAG: pantoate--beta-alanine ligase [Tidjanibacter sp.]|nr:pantoate--beta-alanine ligase [Tidjanibacter sp.]MBR6830635.1 pantoate--beta-alanine ligase [Tidjanibacter sp.]
MKLITKVADLQNSIKELRTKGSVGFVPTMGALHDGHLSLVKKSCAECAVTVVSIFVNPTQFNDKNDLKNYPRTLEQDMKLLESTTVDIVFAPTVDEVYPEPDTRIFDFGQVDKVMEGASRPGHFNGVGQVVSRLFAMVEPDKAFFGEKDFQQIAVVKEMVRQLGFGVEIIACPIIRESDGLAMSSRNTLLTKEHRAAAPHIHEVMAQAQKKVGEMTPDQLEKWVAEEVDKNPLLKTIYFQAVDALTMQKVNSWENEHGVQGCIAVQAGEIRLIDNIRLV